MSTSDALLSFAQLADAPASGYCLGAIVAPE